ncbi:hypothetical protein [Legionella sp. 16cNR16C]|uniref:hypothetical protein n=1 Tax=Legionella sp. 16cNR16C TaxID=2905656 RepID=UPI001E33221C|nr:hypothetical protein [Legionella sp. 16cNR16C]MCE3046428.1 hypothetical protein [Legionella sp. 16cNR16C]
MKDRYGRLFEENEIRNADCISFTDFKSLHEFGEDELVLITDADGGKRVYLFSDLQEQLKSGHYCRLTDPMTRQDILNQIPEFKAAIHFEENAVHYNAYILDQYPHLIQLLKTYVEEVLNIQDEKAGKGTLLNIIQANHSPRLAEFYQEVADLPVEERDALYSLFITNRTVYKMRNRDGNYLYFPAKWIPTVGNLREQLDYKSMIERGYYTPFPHRNVRLSDVISNPEDACMHSWGMDILNMLLEYHVGSNKEFRIFNPATNCIAHRMEQDLRHRVEKSITQPLHPQKGKYVFEQAKKVTAPGFFLSSMTPEHNTAESVVMLTKLNKACEKYMQHLLNKMNVNGLFIDYPLPATLVAQNRCSDDKLINKYKAVYELYESLHVCGPGIDNNSRINQFAERYNEENRQNTIAEHRDGAGIRFLNVLFSILTVGIKNLVTHWITGGYYGFWDSRGASFNNEAGDCLTAYTAAV